jgi:Fe-S-cluster-containing dehydrogenase component
MYFQPRMCQHCVDPPCIESCPFDAIEKRADGVVAILDRNCTGCEFCLPACPYDVISMNDDQRVVAICDMCSERLGLGLRPACAEACPGDAIVWGDVHAEDSDFNVQRRRLNKPLLQLEGGRRGTDRPSGRYQSRRPPRAADRTISEVPPS